MSPTLLLTLSGIAVVDSLNPFLFASQFYLMTTAKPLARILAYIGGILMVNFVAGILILFGARELIGDLVASISPNTSAMVQLAFGVALIGFGLWQKLNDSAQQSVADTGKKPRTLQPIHTFLLGMVVMLNEMTTALPYFVAIERIIESQVGWESGILALLLYNVVFSLPLFAFLGALLVLRQRFMTQIESINRTMQRWIPRIMKYGALGFGIFLVVSGGWFFIGLAMG
jgi:cytochrome c biogenesis protein CcdA